MMKMAKAEFTPGPWRVVKVFGKCKRRILTEKGSVLADIHNRREFQERGGAEMKANAALIAAAPDLLAALIKVVSVADRQTVEFDAARAAIAKARGQ
jgi:hypothetical protein